MNRRDHPNIIAGYGTLALEIMDQVPGVDAIIVPVGSGGLAAGIVSVMKTLKPSCLIYVSTNNFLSNCSTVLIYHITLR